MKTKYLATLMGLLAITPVWAATQSGGNYTVNAAGTETGDLTVAGDALLNGSIEVLGSIDGHGTFTLGTTGETTPRAGISLLYGESGTTYKFSLIATRPAASFLWQDNGGATAASKMLLDGSNMLSLFDSTGAAGIVLNPNTGTVTLSTAGGGLVLPDGTNIRQASDLHSSALYDAAGNPVMSVDSSGNLSVTAPTTFQQPVQANGGVQFAPGLTMDATGAAQLNQLFTNLGYAPSSNDTSAGGPSLIDLSTTNLGPIGYTMVKYSSNGTLFGLGIDGGAAFAGKIGGSMVGGSMADFFISSRPSALAADSQGNYSYWAGTSGGAWAIAYSTDGSLVGGTVPAGSGYLIKMDSSGIIAWVQTLGGTPTNGVAVDNNGNSYVTLNPYDSSNVGIVQKLDASGNIIWTKQFDGVQFSAVSVDGAGNSYLAGSVSGTVNLEGANLTNGEGSCLVKLNTSGDMVWAEQYGGTYFGAIATDVNGYTKIAGSFSGTLNLGSASLASSGGLDVFVLSIDPDGNVSNAQKFGGRGDDVALGIGVDQNGITYLAGQFAHSMVIGSRLLSTEGTDYFAAEISADGVVTGADQLGSRRPAGNFVMADCSTGNIALLFEDDTWAPMATVAQWLKGTLPPLATEASPQFTWGGGVASGSSAVAFGSTSQATGQSAFAGEASSASGDYSAALSGGLAFGGYSAALAGGTATGSYSAAMSGGDAVGSSSTAFSSGSSIGDASTAMSGGESYGNYSIAMSGGSSYGNYSTAMSGGQANGIISTAMSGGSAGGNNSTAMSGGQAWGVGSTAMSGGNATGDWSVAMGLTSVAKSYQSLVIGRSNAFSQAENSTSWVAADPLFVIGNGTGIWNDPPQVRNHNAFTVYKNGNVQIGQTTLKSDSNGLTMLNSSGAPGLVLNPNGGLTLSDGTTISQASDLHSSALYNSAGNPVMSVDGSGNLSVTAPTTFQQPVQANGGVQFAPGVTLDAGGASHLHDLFTNLGYTPASTDTSGGGPSVVPLGTPTDFSMIRYSSSGDIYGFGYDQWGLELTKVGALWGGETLFRQPTTLAVDSQDNIYLMGASSAPWPMVNPPYGLIPGGDLPAGGYLVKFDSGANPIWAQALGGDSANGIAVDDSGNSYVTLNSHDSNWVGVAQKLDTSGNILWTKQFNGVHFIAISIDGAGNSYLAGYLEESTVNIGSASLVGTRGSFLMKLTPSGEVAWAKQYGGWFWTMATDANGYTKLAGTFSGTLNLGTTSLASSGATDIFVLSINPNGNFSQAWKFGGPGDDTPDGVGVDQEGKTYLEGQFTGSMMVGGTAMHTESTDHFVAEISAAGTITGADQLGSRSPAGDFVMADLSGGNIALLFRDENLGSTIIQWSKGSIPKADKNPQFAWGGGMATAPSAAAFGSTSQANGESAFAAGASSANGNNSAALAGGTAAGIYSTAFSGGTTTGDYSSAMSSGQASGDHATALGSGTASGDYSTALAGGVALGDHSVAMSDAYARGDTSTGMSGGSANGMGSTALSGGQANGDYSTAMSNGNSPGYSSTGMSEGTAIGDYSVAMGPGSLAGAYQSVVLGRNNTSEGDPTTWVETDPLFVIGNGTGDSNDPPEVQNRNAFTVYKNGNVQIGQTTLKSDSNGLTMLNSSGAPGLVFNSNGGLTLADGTTISQASDLRSSAVYDSSGAAIIYSGSGSGSVSMSYGTAAGLYSTAMSYGSAVGVSSTAMSGGVSDGIYSIAMSGGHASGESSTAMSFGFAAGPESVAMSYGVVVGNYSTAMTFGQAGADNSTAMSGGSNVFGADYSTVMSMGTATAPYSTAMSAGTANGDTSTAMSGGIAGGVHSVAMGAGSNAGGSDSTATSGGTANGDYSVAMGVGSLAASAQSVVFGRNNVITGTEDPNNWVETDPLFVIGNGTGNGDDPPEVQNRNALTVYKNGDVKITKRQGDILMGEFGN